MQPAPDVGGRRVAQTAPAAYAAAHLARQQVPAQARRQDEQDASEHCPVIEWLASGVARPAWFGQGQQGFNECPQLTIEYRLRPREIARQMGLSRNTVRRYLRDEQAPRYKQREPRPTKLDPFKDYLLKCAIAARPHWIPATVLASGTA